MVHKGSDTISAKTRVVGGENFKITTYSLHFKAAPSNNSSKITFLPADNAVFYDMEFVFTYHESHDGGPMVDKQVSYSCGTKSIDELVTENNQCFFTYSENILFNLLETAIGADTVYNANHPNVERSFDTKPIQIKLSAGGDELYNYIQVNSQAGFSQAVPDYTNVSGGYGVFSSRINLVHQAGISAAAQKDLYGKESWGFVQH